MYPGSLKFKGKPLGVHAPRGVATDFRMGGGSNRRQGGQPTPKYPKNLKKTPDCGHFILESGGSTRPVFKSAGVTVRTPRPPPPLVGDAPCMRHYCLY